jgi:polar amino acid transport system substrate-binding protein
VAGKWAARWDLSIGSMTITSARAKVVDFSSPYYYTPAQFGVHKKNTTIKKLDDFSGKIVGLGSGTTYETYLDPKQELGIGGGEKIVYQVKNVKKIRIYTTDMEAVQDLALGDGVRIDGVLTSGFRKPAKKEYRSRLLESRFITNPLQRPLIKPAPEVPIW